MAPATSAAVPRRSRIRPFCFKNLTINLRFLAKHGSVRMFPKRPKISVLVASACDVAHDRTLPGGLQIALLNSIGCTFAPDLATLKRNDLQEKRCQHIQLAPNFFHPIAVRGAAWRLHRTITVPFLYFREL